MITFILWILGIILSIKAIIEIWNMELSGLAKVIAIVVLLMTSWLGLIIYYFAGRKNLPTWFKNIK
jgi:type III secretory pathway component EscS